MIAYPMKNGETMCAVCTDVWETAPHCSQVLLQAKLAKALTSDSHTEGDLCFERVILLIEQLLTAEKLLQLRVRPPTDAAVGMSARTSDHASAVASALSYVPYVARVACIIDAEYECKREAGGEERCSAMR